MDIEKLIERLKKPCWGESAHLLDKERLEAATALSTLKTENEKLRAELAQARESLDFARTKDAEILRLGMELGHLKKHMERLTYRLGNGEITCNMARDDCRKMGGDCQIDSKILESLAAYEATGLEPKEVAKMAAEWTKYETAMSYVDEIGINRLRELARADREGRCVVLPVKLHDKLYYVDKEQVQETEVESIHNWTSGRWKLSTHTDRQFTHWIGYEVDFDGIGKTVFLTREEAEAALEGMKNG